MNKFIAFTFLMLGLGFYEMSGGADFVPETRPTEQIATVTETTVPFDAPQVTRAAAIELPNFTTAQAEVITASLDTSPVIEEAAPIADIRTVAGARVNMRSGPSTNDAVLDTLTRGTVAEVIEINDDGWARIRVSDTNQIGWMATRLLSDG